MTERERLQHLASDGDNDATRELLRVLEREGDHAALHTLRSEIGARFATAARELSHLPMPEDIRLSVGFAGFVEGIGLGLKLSLYTFQPSYQCCQGELLLVPENQLAEWPDAMAQLRARIEQLAQIETAREALVMNPEDAFGLPPIEPEAISRTTPSEARQAARAAALEASLAKHPQLADQMQSMYGLRLPRHLAVFDAFYRTTSPFEEAAMSYLGLSPGGILTAFAHKDGLDRPTRDDLDPRLDVRFRRDPPELVTVVWGDSDGLHFGLWYDDPGELPSCIAANYARDDAETYTTGSVTLREMVLERMDDLYLDETDAPLAAMAALRRALEDFAEADAEALRADGPIRHREATRYPWTGGLSGALPPGSGVETLDMSHAANRLRYPVYRSDPDTVRVWIQEARNALDAGRPAHAMMLGRELHWVDHEAFRDDARDLLIAAYEALDRQALADIVRVHYRHRDLRSVAVFAR